MKTGGRVAVASGVFFQRASTGGGVSAGGCVALERGTTDGCVFVAGGVAKERVRSIGSVGETSRIVKERLVTVGRVLVSGGIRKQRLVANRSVLVPRPEVIEKRMKPHGSAPWSSARIQRPIASAFSFIVQYNHTHSGRPLWSLRTLWSRWAL